MCRAPRGTRLPSVSCRARPSTMGPRRGLWPSTRLRTTRWPGSTRSTAATCGTKTRKSPWPGSCTTAPTTGSSTCSLRTGCNLRRTSRPPRRVPCRAAKAFALRCATTTACIAWSATSGIGATCSGWASTSRICRKSRTVIVHSPRTWAVAAAASGWCSAPSSAAPRQTNSGTELHCRPPVRGRPPSRGARRRRHRALPEHGRSLLSEPCQNPAHAAPLIPRSPPASGTAPAPASAASPTGRWSACPGQRRSPSAAAVGRCSPRSGACCRAS
mmetsp:Transcript_20241/g.60639  ORF Transcript_20241/g.60639 Transcript_20241/m.60639 type:complete len:272 (+) Transcript_20241:892-1707(+)